jgi:predicted ATPase
MRTPPITEPLKLKLSNYRSISAEAPLTIPIERGVTFVVGINNVGKSNILRAFFELRPAFKFVFEEIQHPGRHGGQEPRIQLPRLPADSLFHQKSKHLATELVIANTRANVDLSLSAPEAESLHSDHYKIGWRSHAPASDKALQTAAADLVGSLMDTMYVGPLRTPLPSVSGQIRDIHIGVQFIQNFNEWANGDIVERRRKTAELIRELQAIFGYKRFNLTVGKDSSTLMVENDDGTFRLDELGDGIGHFILVLASAMMKSPSLILIDEPELGLHPKMQEAFVRHLAAKAKFGVLATSHSIGLARSTADKILSLSKNDDGSLSLNPFGQHTTSTLSQSLHELGFSQIVELGATHLLLVEGQTDIKAFREILRHFGIEQHFMIWHLGGAPMLTAERSRYADELNDLLRMQFHSVTVIFDSERSSAAAPANPAFNEFMECCRGLGFHAFQTDYHSTENYVTQAALDKVFPGKKALLPYLNRNKATDESKWPKSSNWLLFREMSNADFIKTELGQFIETVLVPAVERSKKAVAG